MLIMMQTFFIIRILSNHALNIWITDKIYIMVTSDCVTISKILLDTCNYNQD